MDAMVRWFLTPTGLFLLAGGGLLGAGLAIDDGGFLAAVGVVMIVVVIARNTTLHSRRLTTLTDDLARSNQAALERQRTAERNLDDRLASIRSRADELETRVDALTREIGDQQVATSTAEDERVDIRSELARISSEARDARSDLHEQVVTIRNRITSAIERERSVRSLSIARMTDSGAFPQRVLVLMTLHRSGSTRLFDICRTHPGTEIASTADVWDRLGLRGRRYPVAFSDLPTSWRAIEIEHARGATIPEVPVAQLPFHATRWSLEKAHPQFCDFDADVFAQHIFALRDEGVEVEVAYGVRSPIDAMWSMVAFQRRQPSWYAFLTSSDIPDWVRRSLDAMADMRDRVPGVVLDYEDVPDGAPVRSLGARLAPEWDPTDLDAWLAFADGVTLPDRPAQAGTGFLGGSTEREEDGPDGSWADLADVIADADQAYQRLRP
ncbi:MAG: hypothetical protein AAGC53_03550 [Actinomycetota bacterium]